MVLDQNHVLRNSEWIIHQRLNHNGISQGLLVASEIGMEGKDGFIFLECQALSVEYWPVSAQHKLTLHAPFEDRQPVGGSEYLRILCASEAEPIRLACG